jgi:predicted metal-dependent peptidase
MSKGNKGNQMTNQIVNGQSVEAAIRDLIVDGKEIFYGQLITKFARKYVTNETKGRFAVPTAAVTVSKNEVVLIVNVDFFDNQCECDAPHFTSKKVDGVEEGSMHFCDFCGCLETRLTSENRKAIIKHECQHIAHRHLTRGSVDAGYHPQMANIAMDAVINQLNDGLPIGCIDFQKIDGAKPNDTWENYYALLEKKQEEQECQTCGGSGQKPEDQDGDQDGSGDQDENDSGDQEQEQDGSGGQGDEDQDGGNQDGHSHGESGQPCPDCGGTGQTGYGQAIDSHDLWQDVDGESNMDIVDATIREQIRKTAEGIGIGNLPQEVREIVEGLVGESKINWRKVLRTFIQESFRRERFQSPFRENVAIDGVFPGSAYKKLPEFDVYVDASGSIGNDDFLKFMREVITINKSLKATVKLHQWDTEIHHSEVIEQRVPDLIRAACGGTDVKCVIDHARKHKNRNLIIMTDGYFENRDNLTRGLNILWCYTENSQTDHKGKKIVLDD